MVIRNKPKRKTLTVDLHYKTSREATDMVNQVLEDWQISHPEYERINFIVGKGNHSQNGAVLRPLVCEYISKLNYDVSEMEANRGIVSVMLRAM